MTAEWCNVTAVMLGFILKVYLHYRRSKRRWVLHSTYVVSIKNIQLLQSCLLHQMTFSYFLNVGSLFSPGGP